MFGHKNENSDIIAIKHRAYPSGEAQHKYFAQCFGNGRKLYNLALELQETTYKKTKKKISYCKLSSEHLLEWKKEFPYLEETPSQSLQAALLNLETAYKNFFKGTARLPTFKSRYDRQSMCFPQGGRCEIKECEPGSKYHTIKLPLLKKPLKFVRHRKAPEGSHVRRIFVSKDAHNEFFITITYGIPKNKAVPIQSRKENLKSVGIDMGITNTLALSDGSFLNMPIQRILEVEKELARQQRRVAREREKLKKLIKLGKRKRLPSKVKIVENARCAKIRKVIKKLHRQIVNQRNDFAHKVSHTLVKNHDVIVIENLRLTKMTKSAKGTVDNPGKNVAQKSGLNRSLLRASLGRIKVYLTYKTQKQGKILLLVPPQNTSRKCHKCGFISKENRQTQSEFCCQKCGHSENADTNASQNILALGMGELEGLPSRSPL